MVELILRLIALRHVNGQPFKAYIIKQMEECMQKPFTRQQMQSVFKRNSDSIDDISIDSGSFRIRVGIVCFKTVYKKSSVIADGSGLMEAIRIISLGDGTICLDKDGIFDLNVGDISVSKDRYETPKWY